MTPADELRAAATRLREMAAEATKPRKPEYGWDFLGRDELRDPSYTDVVCSQSGGVAAVASFVDWPDAAWIALLGPDKAEPLAAWLDASAQSMPWQFVHSDEQAAALAFARSILHTEGDES